MTTCKNCSHEFEGNYCSQCGQKASTKRFSARILFSELLDKLFPLDRGVLFTARHLMTRPGPMLREYLGGKRAKYTKPIQFLLVMVAISLIFLSQDDFQQGMQDGIQKSQDPAAREFTKKMTDWISANMTALIVGIIPFMALMARWIFRKRGINYAEHFVITCYFIGGSTLLGMPLLLVMKLFGQNAYSSVASPLFGAIYLVYCIWVYIGFFKDHNPWSTGIKGVLAILLGYVLFILTAMLVGIFGALIYFFIWGKG